MTKNLIQKIISVVLLVIVLIIIFMLSAMESDASAKHSRKIFKNIISINFIKNNIKQTDTYINIEKNVNALNIPNEDKEELVMQKIARKYDETFRESMHAFEYTVLAFVSLIVLKQFGIKGKKIFIFSISFCFIYACLDEYHQIFVEGRGCELLDIELDVVGIILGTIICELFVKIFKKINNKNVIES